MDGGVGGSVLETGTGSGSWTSLDIGFAGLYGGGSRRLPHWNG